MYSTVQVMLPRLRLVALYCVMCLHDKRQKNIKWWRIFTKTNRDRISCVDKTKYWIPKHFTFIYISHCMYTARSDTLFLRGFPHRWQEEQDCLQSLCQHEPPIALISVTQHPGCSTTQPAGYWTCEAFPCSEDLSHKQSLKTAWDWLALGVIDCRNQSHKNDCIGSWVAESINYRAMPADLNISSPPSTSLIPKPHRGICDRCVANLFCGWDVSATHLHRVLPLEKAYLSL